MPINYAKYPPNWKTEIRPRILARAENRCEFCGVRNGDVGHRDRTGHFNYCGECFSGASCEGPRLITIVLTVAHLNHEPTDCADDNLRALCQKCHLNYDAEHHQRNAAATRRRKIVARGQGELM